MSEHERFARNDAAYVLGALAPDERLEYEAHLRTCPQCAGDVGELAGLPGLLATVSLEDVLRPPEPVPETLAPALARAVRRERRTRRVATVAAAAAVAVAAGVVGVVTGHAGSSPTPAATSTGTAMSQVVATPVHASARLVGLAWGTRIDLTCTYDGSRYANAAGGAAYSLVVVDRSGDTQQVATWRAVPDGVSRVSGATAWSPRDIARVEIRTASGAPVLRLLS